MYQIEYRNKIYEAATEKELYLSLRKEAKLTLKEIGELVRKKKQRISQIVGPVGRLEFPELRNPKLFQQESDEKIALNFNFPISRVSAARRKLGLKSRIKINVWQRRKRLAEFLFGKKEAGPNFIEFIKEQIQKLSEGKARVIEDFYILGISQSLSDNVNTDSDRVYRVTARRELKKIVSKFDVKELVENGVIADG